jgi:DNA-binding NarL/FixJ family response regulator
MFVLINTNDFAVFETLASALHATGATSEWESHEGSDVHGCDLGVWDGGQLDSSEQQRLRLYCQRFAHAPAPVLVLLDYPRTEHREAIRTAGASALLGKPYSVDSLIDALSRLAASRKCSA